MLKWTSQDVDRYLEGDSAWFLAESEGGIRFLGLAAVLVASGEPLFSAAELLHGLLQSSDQRRRHSMPTVRQLQALLQATQPKILSAGFSDNVVQWSNLIMRRVEEERITNIPDDAVAFPRWKPVILTEVLKALSELDRIGEADFLELTVPGFCAAYMISFVKWCTGDVPAVVFAHARMVDSPVSRIILKCTTHAADKRFGVRVFRRTNAFAELIRENQASDSEQFLHPLSNNITMVDIYTSLGQILQSSSRTVKACLRVSINQEDIAALFLEFLENKPTICSASTVDAKYNRACGLKLGYKNAKDLLRNFIRNEQYSKIGEMGNEKLLQVLKTYIKDETVSENVDGSVWRSLGGALCNVLILSFCRNPLGGKIRVSAQFGQDRSQNEKEHAFKTLFYSRVKITKKLRAYCMGETPSDQDLGEVTPIDFVEDIRECIMGDVCGMRAYTPIGRQEVLIQSV